MTDTPQLLLAHHLKALKLPTFLREYDKLARQCAAEGLDHIRFLLRLAELELIDRERRMVERRIAPKAVQNDTDLLFGRMALSGCPADVLHNPLRWRFSVHGFLSCLMGNRPP